MPTGSLLQRTDCIDRRVQVVATFRRPTRLVDVRRDEEKLLGLEAVTRRWADLTKRLPGEVRSANMIYER